MDKWLHHHKLWDEITYPFPTFNGATVEVLEWLNIHTSLTGHVISYKDGIEVNPCSKAFQANYY